MMQQLRKLLSLIVLPIGKIYWKTKKELSQEDKEKIKKLLADDYYIVLTRRANHLSTYFIAINEWFLTKKLGYWAHSVMNLENAVTDIRDFRLMEATGVGVHYSNFDEVFNVQSVVLMKPKNMSLEKWTSVLDEAEAQVGKPYDTLFEIYDSSKLSCIELTRKILMGDEHYMRDFSNFENMILKYKNLSPQMLYDCEDFEIALEIKI